MNTFSGKAMTIIMMFVMIINQFEPVAALQSKAQAPAAPASETADVVAPIAQREMSKKAAKPLEYNQPAAPKLVQPSIKLSAKPKFVTGSGSVLVTWVVKGDLPKNHALTLLVTLADGYTPDPSIHSYDASSHILSLLVTAASGQFVLNVQNPVDNIVFPVSLMDGTQVLAETSLSLSKHEKFNVKKNPSTGSGQTTVSARNGRVKIRFGAGTLVEDTAVEFGAPTGDDAPVTSLSGQPFEIDAQGVQSKQDLHQFSGDISIDVDYSSLDLGGKSESNLYLYWYDPATQDWYALPSSVDPTTKTLHATTTHFSVFDTGINDFTASHLPTVDAFQVSGFTGAATYSLPIEVPAMPGGLQPNINLSYNSQTIDQSTAQTQPSWVGMGWSLGMNSIELDDHGTNEINTNDSTWSHDDSWSVNVNGVSSTIVKNGSTYRASDENFMKFDYDPTADTWTVWDKQGNIYYFEQKVQTVYSETGDQNTSSDCRFKLVTYQWFLKRMVNIFGKQFTYTYYNETKTINVPEWTGTTHGCQVDLPQTLVTATYPDTITYPGARYRVRFQREARTDYRASWLTDAAYHNFQHSRLDSIFVEQDAAADGTFENIIRKYDFIYASNAPGSWTATTTPVWQGIKWTKGGYNSTLLQVKQYGVGAVGQLPTATFTYGDGMHLTSADNGYGGGIDFEYQSWKYTTNARASQTFEEDYNYGGPASCDTGHFVAYPSGNPLTCRHDGNGNNYLKVRGKAINSDLLNSWAIQNNRIRPGGFYKFTFDLLSVPDNMSFNYGFRFIEAPDQTIYNTNGSVVVALPATASQADVLVNAAGSTDETNYVMFRKTKVQLLTAVYRITARKVSDGQGHTDTYTYAYVGGAVNDNATSASACTDAELNNKDIYGDLRPLCQQYHEKYSEFRGHSQVTETDPNGRKVVTTFNQDDLLKGRPSAVTTIDVASGKTLSKKLTVYDVTSLAMTRMYSKPYGVVLYYDDVTRNWITTASEENRTYASNGTSYTATLTEYDYEATYGNQLMKTESAWNGASWDVYRKSQSIYYFTNTSSVYLVGLPALQRVMDPSSTVLSQTLNIYDANTAWNVAPTAGKLSAIRTWVNGSDYSQVSYGYDGWGNRNSSSTYNTYATPTANPTSAAITQTSTFDTTYHAYPLTQTNALGQATTFTYDYTLGLPLSQTDPNGVTTSVEYDGFGRLLKLIKAGDSSASPTLQVVYNDNLNPFRIDLQQKVDGTSNYLIRHSYDGIGREIDTETGHGSFGAFVLDNAVNYQYYYIGGKSAKSQSDQRPTLQSAIGSTTRTVTISDVLGRPLTVTAPDNTVTTHSYNGLITNVTDVNSHTTVTTKDLWGNTVLVTPPTGPAVIYAHDLLGQLTDATRAGLTTHLNYDKAKHKLNMSDPDMGYWSYTYDTDGNLTTQTDARGCISTLVYDNLNRLTGKVYTGSCDSTPDVTYNYDQGGAAALAVGRRTSMSDGSGSTSWAYDARGRMLSETKTITGQPPFITSFTYNNADLQLSMTYPDGEVVTNTYTPQKMLDTLSGAANYVTDTSYDIAGRMTNRAFGNGTQSTSTYYPWSTQGGRLQTVQSGTGASPASLQNITYTYDPVGNINTISDALVSETQAFGYDTLDRLTSATVTGGPAPYSGAYSYNATTGNLEVKGTTTLYYDDVNHKHAVSSTSASDTYTYDADGNQTTRVIGGQIYNLAYDAEGRLISVQNANPPTPTATVTATKTSTVTATMTATATVTSTPTATATVTQTVAPSETPTQTLVPSDTPTVAATETATETPLPTETPVPTDTNTPDPAQTNTATPTETPLGGMQPQANAFLASYIIPRGEDKLPAPAKASLDTFTSISAVFTYDGDGKMVKSVMDGVTTLYVSAVYQLKNPSTAQALITKYYMAGTQIVAVRTGATLSYLLSDHLGSTSVTTNVNGEKVAELRYNAWGTVRYASGSTPTDQTYTSQRTYASEFGLMYYNARWYDSSLGRFAQADNIELKVGDTQSLERFAYVSNNPIRLTDPTGHIKQCHDETDANGKTTQVCTGSDDTCSSDDPNIKDLNPLHSDYTTSTLSVGGLVGITVSWTVDRYGQNFLSLGVTAGKSLTAVSFTHVDGWVGSAEDNKMPLAKESASFLTGLSSNVTGIFPVSGGGLTFSPGNGVAIERGAGMPQVGGSVSIGWKQSPGELWNASVQLANQVQALNLP